ncbi:glutathione S-transferase D7-like [Styela clava]
MSLKTDIHFYYNDMSPPSRTVWMLLHELDLQYTAHSLNLRDGEQKTEDFAKINIRQKVPAITDGDFCLGESRAIAAYIVSEYGDQQNKRYLYPAENKARTKIDQHLYISENVVEAMVGYTNVGGVLMCGEKMKEEKIGDVKKYLAMLEGFLTEHEYTASNNITIADFFYYMSISFLFIIDFNNFDDYPKFVAWTKKMEKLPYYNETCGEPIKQFREKYQTALKEGLKKATKK